MFWFLIYLIASHSLETCKFLSEIRQANGVMKNPVSTVVVGVRTSDDTYQRQILAVSSRNSVYDAESSYGESDNTSANTAWSSVAICRVASVKLVAAANEIETRLGYEMVKQREIEVAGNWEDIVDADLDETMS